MYSLRRYLGMSGMARFCQPWLLSLGVPRSKAAGVMRAVERLQAYHYHLKI